MNGSRRGVCAGVTFLLGFGAALWLSGAGLGELRGPRAQLMRELNALRAAAGAPALRADRPLGQVAQQRAESLARGSQLALSSNALELERGARSRGWRGSAPLLELRVHAADLGAALDAAAKQALLEPARAAVGVGVAPAPGGERIAVVLLESPPAQGRD